MKACLVAFVLTVFLCYVSLGKVKNGDAFDFIVVGSGPGGGPLAAKLAMSRFRVLLIEAGEDYIDDTVRIPFLFSYAADNPEISWDVWVRHYANDTQQQRDTKYYPDKDGVLYPRASGIGGCGLHHVLNLLYPANPDFERIQDMFNDDSWSPENMRSYFERIENNRYYTPPATAEEQAATRYGYDGWATSEMFDFEKLEEMVGDDRISFLKNFPVTHGGYADLGDFNRWENNGKPGRANPVMASRNQQRWGLVEYIKRVQREYPNNLIIETNALASKILFQGTTAIGVEFLKGRALYQAHRDYDPDQRADKINVYANYEVIISGGTFNSPQLLKLSGVGPKDELKSMGIPVVVDLPGVGENMQDRYEVGLNFKMKSPWGAYTQCNFKLDTTDTCYNLWKANGSSLYGSNIVLYWSAKQSSVSDLPDLCLFTGMGYFLGYSPEVIPQAEANGYQSQVFLNLKAFTENTGGTVRLKSKDPREVPEIVFHYFEEGTDREGKDLQAVLEGIKELRRLTSIPDYQVLVEEEIGTFANARTDDEIRQKIRDEAWGHHACCTNKIGVKSDEKAVVDSNFKVHGTQNLRVVDASVFPRIPGYFVLSAVYMISEKAADVIIQDAIDNTVCEAGSSLASSSACVLSVPFIGVVLIALLQCIL